MWWNYRCYGYCIKKNDKYLNLFCYYFDDVVKLEDFDIDNILIDENLQENNFIYDMSCTTLIVIKPSPMRFS